jgi:hypothetical protein
MKKISRRRAGMIGLLVVVVGGAALAIMGGVSSTSAPKEKSLIPGMSADDAKQLIKLQGGKVQAMKAKNGCKAPTSRYPTEAPTIADGAPASGVAVVETTGDLLENPVAKDPVSVIQAEVLNRRIIKRQIRVGKESVPQWEAKIVLRVCETMQGPKVPNQIVLFQLRGQNGTLLESEPEYTKGERYQLFVRPRLERGPREYILVSPQGRAFILANGTVDFVSAEGAASETLGTIKTPENVLKVVNADLTIPHDHEGGLTSVAAAKKIMKKNKVNSYEEAAALALEEAQ